MIPKIVDLIYTQDNQSTIRIAKFTAFALLIKGTYHAKPANQPASQPLNANQFQPVSEACRSLSH